MTTIELGAVQHVGLDDALNFGKFKGKTYRELLDTQAGYLCWLVDQELSGEGKKKGYNSLTFAPELLVQLSVRIKRSGSLQIQYSHLILDTEDVAEYEAEEQRKLEQAQRKKEEEAAAALAAVQAKQAQYSAIGWASW